MVREALIFIALSFAIVTGILAVWLFLMLVSGYDIGPDPFNRFELGASIVILIFTVAVLVVHMKYMFRRQK